MLRKERIFLSDERENGLQEELEDIRDKFQAGIDEMMAAHPDKDWNDFVKEAAMEQENQTPAAAGEQESQKFTWWSFFIPAIALIFLAFAIIFLVNGWSLFSNTAVAQKRAIENRPVSALAKYEAMNQGIDESSFQQDYGWKYLKNQVKLYDKLGLTQMEQMGSFLETHYTDKALKSCWNHYAKNRKAEYDQYNTAIYAFQDAMQESSSYKGLVSTFDKEIAGKNINPSYVNFFHYYAALMTGQKPAEQHKSIEGIKDKKLRYPIEAEYCLNSKDWDGAVRYSNKILRSNKENTYAYVYKSFGQRTQKDLAGARETAETGLAVDSHNGPLYYQLSVLELLKGNYAKAGEYAYTSATYSLTDQAVSLNAMIYGLRANAYKKAGNEKAYEKMMSGYNSMLALLKQGDAAPSPDVAKVISGQKTVADVFLKGTGDLA